MASIFLVIFSFGLRFVLWSYDWSAYHFTFTRLDALSFGSILALLEPTLRQCAGIVRKTLPIFLIALMIPLLAGYRIFSGSGIYFIQISKFTLVAGFYFLLVSYLVVSPADSLTNRLFSHRIAVYIGSISYGLYVYHQACFSWIAKLAPNYPIWISMPYSFIFAIIVAHISFRFVEKPFLQLKKRLVKY